jgi:hypothetical protein
MTRPYLTGCIDLPCSDLHSWSQIVQAVLLQVTQIAHEAVTTPSRAKSQRRVALLLSPTALADKSFAAGVRSVNQALGLRMDKDFAVRYFSIKSGDCTHHQLSWSGF